MNRKLLALLLCVAMVVCMFSFASCGKDTGDKDNNDKGEEKVEVKVGFIFLHDENSTYDKNFMDAAKAACETMGVEYAQKTQIPESTKCYDAAVELIEVDGCNVIFADSFGHESFLMQAAEEYKDVQFCHATGTQAHTAGLDNFHNAFASIYEGRYLAGVAAGLKLNEMIAAGEFEAEDAKIGYVGAFTFAEVISGYTSFYLGAKSVCPSVTMEVQFTGSWYDEQLEKEAAQALIGRGCKLISQHADSMGSPTACEAAGIPNVSYNGSTLAACPNTFIVSSRINWAPYFEHMIECVENGEAIEADWTGTIETESVLLTDVNDKAAAEGTADKLADVKKGLLDGTIHVFDTKNFTVGGETLSSYKADVDTDDKFTPDTEVIEDGIFYESKHRSAPYFDIRIDGITLLNEKY
ncbi:MAG: BMP family ABC transporter substrate-binding protein [Clostridia bacterium]|nr:BMP family ABC transporter substrate-binding protein [Clostridia bacterium]